MLRKQSSSNCVIESPGRRGFFHEATVLRRRIYHGAIVLCALVCVMICPPLRGQSPGVDAFDPMIGGVPPVVGTPYPAVYALAVQPDGRIILGGNFTNIGGHTCGSIARVNPDGSLDTTFGSGANGLVETILVQSDGKILVSGDFDIFAGEVRKRIARLNADGALDTAFNPEADWPVLCMALQADGKILVGGGMTMLGGQQRKYIGRLNSGGTLDASFNPGADAPVHSISLQPDGKILVGGAFSNLGGQGRKCIGRLNSGGSLDTGFNLSSAVSGFGGYTYVSCLVVQPDGKILVGGDFNLQARRSLVRLNSNGSLDTNFVGRTDYVVYSMDLQVDGKILVGGVFENLGGQPRRNFGRLNPDGSLDGGFNLNARGSSVNSLALQSDGKILVGGVLGPLGGQLRSAIGRVNASAPATQSLVYDGSTINWLRGGTGAEVWRVTFDWSIDGLVWNLLGDGTRIAGGWRRTGASIPAQATIRARGFASGGDSNGSSCCVEDRIWYVGPLPLVVDRGAVGLSNVFAFDTVLSRNQPVVVEASSDFLNWVSVYTNAPTNGTFRFSDPIPSSNSLRFYRAYQVP